MILHPPTKKLIVIAGPTAVGKTALSILLAKHFSTEIISADSRQFYREMNIGTAKPTNSQLEEVKHHFINSLSITHDYNAGRYESDCTVLLAKLFTDHNEVILVGGSGLYINAVLYGIDQLPTADPELRKSLNELFEQKGLAALQEQLQQLDAEYFKKVDQENPQRLMRALEVCMITGKKYSALLGKQKTQRNFTPVIIGLNTDRELLYKYINERVDNMMANGLTEEVKSLLPYKNCNAMQTVGYKEMIKYFEEKYTLEEAVELIKKNTRNYAKRQITWFKKMDGIKWFEASDAAAILQYILAVRL